MDQGRNVYREVYSSSKPSMQLEPSREEVHTLVFTTVQSGSVRCIDDESDIDRANLLPHVGNWIALVKTVSKSLFRRTQQLSVRQE